MRIQPISNNTFKGLLGQTTFVETKQLYGGEYECDYYERIYHPFADETDRDILENMKKLEQEINASEVENSKTATSGSYTSLRLGSKLDITQKDYEEIMKKSDPSFVANV